MTMNDRKVETIEIGKGVQYAKVAARLAAFHEANPECSIETTCEFKEGFVLFGAKVTCPRGIFTGHSMDKVGGRQKQFEKQETIAVGRALAFAGYLASGDIATAEEMAEVVTVAQLNALKLRFAKEHANALEGLSRDAKSQKFNAWCRGIIKEDVDYRDPQSWEREWFQLCWVELTGVSQDVPFEGVE
jgi:hypothetical protein